MDSKVRARWIALIAGLSLLLLGACHSNRKPRSETVVKAADNNAAGEVKTLKPTEKGTEEADFPIKQEFRHSFKLAPNAAVSITGINGLLEVETADTDTAELYIVRSVRQEDDFNDHDLMIETQSGKSRIVRSVRPQDNLSDRDLMIGAQSDKLRIRIQQQRKRSFWSMLTPRSEERQRAYLKLPRQVQFNASGVHGTTRIGEIGGRVALYGLTGPVTVARATGGAEMRGISGNIEMTLAQFSEGIEVSGVNGNIDLRFAGAVNANIQVRGVNGNVNPELPNVTVLDQRRGRLEARVGNGGAPIEVHGVNGNINLLPAQTAKTNGGASGVAAK